MTYRFLLLFFTFALFYTACSTPKPTASSTDEISEKLYPFQETITPEFLRSHLMTIADDSFKGRGTGTPHLDKAARYLADFYTKIGMKPVGDDGSYFQYFNLYADNTRGYDFRMFKLAGADTTLFAEFRSSKQSQAPVTRVSGADFKVTGRLVYAGYGIKDSKRGLNHLDGVDLTGAFVIIYQEIDYVVNGDTLVQPLAQPNQRLAEILFRRGARGIIAIGTFDENEYIENAEAYNDLMGQPFNLRLNPETQVRRFNSGIYIISPKLASELIGLDGTEEALRAHHAEIRVNPAAFNARELPYLFENINDSGADVVKTQNVVAFLEGGNPDLKHEVVVLSAHYDHIGVGSPDATGDRIYNGADDNGSGTVGLMGVANAFAQARDAGFRPQRSVLFLHVSAEEVGLLGSRYYSDNPIFPIENTVANINADMIGRIDDYHKARGETDYVYIIGGRIISSGVDSLLNRANKRTASIALNDRYNDLDDPNQFYRRSDHWNFGRLGVPFTFFFTGVHEDYHQPGDTPDKILYDKYSKIVQVMYGTTIELANAHQRPVVDSQEFIRRTQTNPR